MPFDLFQPKDWKLWRGIEVEGRWKGIPTLFVGELASPEDIFALSHIGEHVYFNPQFFIHQSAMGNNGWDTVGLLLKSGHPVTVSGEADLLKAIPETIAQGDLFHFMLVIVLPEILDRELWQNKLSKDDTIRLQFDGSFNSSITVRHFSDCSEDDYMTDYRIL